MSRDMIPFRPRGTAGQIRQSVVFETGGNEAVHVAYHFIGEVDIVRQVLRHDDKAAFGALQLHGVMLRAQGIFHLHVRQIDIPSRCIGMLQLGGSGFVAQRLFAAEVSPHRDAVFAVGQVGGQLDHLFLGIACHLAVGTLRHGVALLVAHDII